jgi:hypothetical protein
LRTCEGSRSRSASSAPRHEEVVDDEDEVRGDARHLAHRGAHVLEVVRGDAAGDDVEAPSANGSCSAGATTSGCMPGADRG